MAVPIWEVWNQSSQTHHLIYIIWMNIAIMETPNSITKSNKVIIHLVMDWRVWVLDHIMPINKYASDTRRNDLSLLIWLMIWLMIWTRAFRISLWERASLQSILTLYFVDEINKYRPIYIPCMYGRFGHFFKGLIRILHIEISILAWCTKYLQNQTNDLPIKHIGYCEMHFAILYSGAQSSGPDFEV